MPDVLVRGISQAALDHHAEKAKQSNASRNDMLVDAIELPIRQAQQGRITAEDWKRFGEAFPDLGNAEIMVQAWR